VARDVNGDDAMDLVVTTAMDSHFVAVLLNDGHGKFTLAKPGAFPSIESDEGIRLVAAQEPAEECAALQFTWSTFGIEVLDDSGTGLEQKSNSHWLAITMRICRACGPGSPGARRLFPFFIPK